MTSSAYYCQQFPPLTPPPTGVISFSSGCIGPPYTFIHAPPTGSWATGSGIITTGSIFQTPSIPMRFEMRNYLDFYGKQKEKETSPSITTGSILQFAKNLFSRRNSDDDD